MPAGVLQFALGLSGGNFTGVAQRAQGAITGLVGSSARLTGVGAALGGLAGGFSLVSGVMDSIGRGDALFNLSKRTGQSVGDLFKLQEAFKAVGLDPGQVSPAILAMQRALGGVNENGEPTAEVFDQIGLSIAQLKGMDAPAQLAAIGKTLAGLGREEAASAAGKIFGRGFAGDMLQLARQSGDFGDGLAKAAQQAALFERNAAAFEKIGDSIEAIKANGRSLFAGIAEGAAPGIQRVVDKLNEIDLSGLGKKIGGAADILTSALAEGKAGELLGLSLQMGAERAFNFTIALYSNPAMWKGVGQAALGAFSAAGTGLLKIIPAALALEQARADKTRQLPFAALSRVPVLGDALGLAGFKTDSFGELFKTHFAANSAAFNKLFGDNFKDAFGFGADGAANIKTALAQSLKEAGASPETQAAWNKMVASLAKNHPVGTEEPARGSVGVGRATGLFNVGIDDYTPGANDEKLGKHRPSEVIALERIGAIFGNNRNVGSGDPARESAGSLKQLVAAQKAANQFLAKIAGRRDFAVPVNE